MLEHINLILLDMFNYYIVKGVKPNREIKEPEPKAGYTAQQLVQYMVAQGWVKNPKYRPGKITCTLDIGGIEQADPDYFTNHIDKVITCLYQERARMNIHDILDFPSSHLERSMDIVSSIERRQLLYAVQVTGGGQIAEISPQGIVYYESRKADFM